MNKFMHVQKKKIEIDKWCEGCSQQQDPGQEYVLQWIYKNGSWFRKAWDESLCKNCAFFDECGYNLLTCCDKYSHSIKSAG